MPYRRLAACFLPAIILAATLLATDSATASNLEISSPRWLPATNEETNASVLFDVQWDDSWRAAWREGDRVVTNWDAAWIFVKLRDDDGVWRHLPVAVAGHRAPPEAALRVPADRAGVFLHGTRDYRGPMKLAEVRLAVASERADVKPEDFQVIGIEMVLIPEGPFSLGNGPPSHCSFFRYPPPAKPFPVESEAALPLGDRDGALTFHPDHHNPAVNGTLPETFPKGFRAFYCMKYGLRWQDYAQMLNLLNVQQATNRFPFHVDTAGFFEGATITGRHPHVKAGNPNANCSNLSWPDGAAVADWCGLRPMTEMEYEKAFRGSFTKIKAEMSGPEMGDLLAGGGPEEDLGLPGTESPDRKAVAGYWVDYEWGPFPKDKAGTIAPGTMYYGVVANGWCEQCVTVGHEKGWGFRGTHGDGNLSPEGDADVPDWPGADGLGSGYRGHYGPPSPSLRVFNRGLAAHGRGSRGHGEKGWRSVRTAP